MTPSDFIAAISPAARSSAALTKIPASFTVAEAAVESGWGLHCPGFNIFGIKADPSWTGPVTIDSTDEDVNGKVITITSRFRAYDGWLGSILDHAQFLLTNPRYKPAFAWTDGASFAKAVQACGYATDPQYASKLIQIMRQFNLSSLDVAAGNGSASGGAQTG